MSDARNNGNETYWLVNGQKYARFESLENGYVLVHSNDEAISEEMSKKTARAFWMSLITAGYLVNETGDSPTDPKSFIRRCARLKKEKR